jgi:GNAT superfamily N-acetyltransferase
MTEPDLDAVERIAGLVHPNFFERREVLAEKQRLYPAGAWVCEDGGAVFGYFLTHPWHTDAIPPLDGMLNAIPKGGTYYFHDLALLPEARRTGAAGTAVAVALGHATKAGYRTATLVAVNNSIEFWGRQGFAVVDVPHLADKLRAYEPGARLMRRALG